jgi:hypothetical protein
MTVDDGRLIEYVTAQRWYGSKGREASSARVVDSATLPGLTLLLVEIRFPEGTHELYQVVAGEELDGLGEPACARELVHLIRAGQPQPAGEGTVEFQRLEGFAGLGSELTNPRLVVSEQTNSSVIFDEELILKVYRRLEAGINPELELLRFLTEHGFRNVAALGGWYAYVGRPLEATLGIVQEFVPNGLDGWELALDELGEAPDRFLGRLRRLGQVTGTMHSVLATDPDDPHFCPEQPSAESLGLLTASVDEEIEQVFLGLPEGVEALEPIARSVANSPLVKCALLGADPNWGRVLQAAGQAIPDAGSAQLDLFVEDTQVARRGLGCPLDREAQRNLEQAMRQPEVEMRIELAGGSDETEIFFCDLSPEYVSFNSEYTT